MANSLGNVLGKQGVVRILSCEEYVGHNALIPPFLALLLLSIEKKNTLHLEVY